MQIVSNGDNFHEMSNPSSNPGSPAKKVKIFSRIHLEIFSCFSQETALDISLKHMKSQILFSGKNKKKTSICCLINLPRKWLKY